MDLVIQTLGTSLQFCIGWVGFRAAKKLHVPSPAIIGALILLGSINLAGVRIPFIPAPVSFIAKVLSGVILGQKIDRDTIGEIKKMLIPLSLSSVWMISISMLAGLILFWAGEGRLSMMTCLASSAAGGIAEMSIFAMSVGADVGIVAFFQSVRIFVVCLSIPFLTRYMAKRRSVYGNTFSDYASTVKSELMSPVEKTIFVCVICCAAFVFDTVGLPSPYMIGAMCGAAAVNLFTGKSFPLPRWLRTIAQICLSITVAVTLSPRTVQLAMELFAPLIVSVALIQALSFTLAWVLSKISHWDAMTLMLATCPGGVSQVIFMAEDYGANPLVVGVFHTIRLISIVVCIPIVAQAMS